MVLDVKDITRSFDGVPVLHEINFQLTKGKTLAILGRSGCGKTTLLKILSGLQHADSGQIFLNGCLLADDIPPQERKIVYLSQEPLLFPHLNIFENMAFGLRVRKAGGSEIKQKVESLAAALGLSQHLSKRPDQLSGGQKQRVSFGRALIIEPPVLLLDEPFGSLDAQTRTEMQSLFREISHARQISSIFVTHDLKEALLMGDGIAYMREGQLKTYPDKISFISDEATGVEAEVAFWKTIST